MMPFRTARELGEEMKRIFEEHPETSEEHFARLVRAGFLNSKGQVTWLIGGEAEPEVEFLPDGTPVEFFRGKPSMR